MLVICFGFEIIIITWGNKDVWLNVLDKFKIYRQPILLQTNCVLFLKSDVNSSGTVAESIKFYDKY